MPFKIDTQTKGIYIISEDAITHYFFQKEETSPGLLVKSHYKEIEGALYLSWLLREGKTVESISAYYHTEDDLKDAPPLEKILPALEKQIDLLTDGEYMKYVDAREKKDWKTIDNYRYWREIQDIWGEINALREKRYYENEIHHRPGVPRIETIGKRLVDEVMDLVWKLDNEAPGIQERVNEIVRKSDNSAIPDFNPEDWE